MHPFCVKTAIGRVIEGVNSAVMVYGQTGSGKTFTMEGTTEEPGVSQQAFSALFQKIRQVQLSSVKAGNGDSVMQFHVRVSYVQIYMERVFDLLVDARRDHTLHLQEDEDSTTVNIPAATNVRVESAAEATALLERGAESRVTAETAMNRSS